MKLNLGCGLDYREGWVNLDFNKGVKADIYHDLNKPLPFKENEVDYILIDNIIEHLNIERVISLIQELHSICKNKAIIEIYAPHYKGCYCFPILTHRSFFGIGKFDSYTIKGAKNSNERYGSARFKINEKLFFYQKEIPFPNWIFNFGRIWQRLMEKFQVFGFDEIQYKLEVVKEDRG